MQSEDLPDAIHNPLSDLYLRRKPVGGSMRESDYEAMRQVAAAMMRRERADHSLQPTALVHEAFLRLGENEALSRSTYIARVAPAMRRILIDHARGRAARKRGDGGKKLELTESALFDWSDPGAVLALHEALEELGATRERTHRVVELRFFCGLTVEETAREMGVSRDTVMDEWTYGRAWLNRRLADDGPYRSCHGY